MTGDLRTTKLRAFFARYVATLGGARDPRVEAAFAAVPREPFAGPGPWRIPAAGPLGGAVGDQAYVTTPDDDPAFLYQDVLIALDAERGIHIGEPSLHAHCLDALALRPGEKALQIGVGSGYYTALLAELVGPEGRVAAYEIDATLAHRATQNLLPWSWVTVRNRTGVADDLPEADVIYVNAAVTRPISSWFAALRAKGRLLFPLQPKEGLGGLLLIRKPADENPAWAARFLSRAAFIACQAPEDTGADGSLAAAFAGGGFADVRSILFDGQPDKSCWLAGDGWWLSTRPP